MLTNTLLSTYYLPFQNLNAQITKANRGGSCAKCKYLRVNEKVYCPILMSKAAQTLTFY